ncbi:hypothetical protein B296_00047482 [Ensete ventricosum]|uniref:Post-SET domain-containing protein n=1 Tax=Ensete ventricosum TaxID=4639 RepID=A0A426YZ94_ENSVE|nr:hypothetical protein B296_00047482 [Ensete ventricosum]
MCSSHCCRGIGLQLPPPLMDTYEASFALDVIVCSFLRCRCRCPKTVSTEGRRKKKREKKNLESGVALCPHDPSSTNDFFSPRGEKERGDIHTGLSKDGIGLGEELTFDYNYVRVFGAAAKKCVCGSSVCRGYIGSDPLDAEVIVQDDSDDEILEPVMAHEDNEKALDIDVSLSYANDVVEKDSDSSIKNKVQLDDSPLISSESEAHQQSSYDVNPLSITSNGLDKGTISRSISEIQLSENCSRSLDDVHNKETSTVQPSLTVIDPISGTALKSVLASNIIDEQQIVSKPCLAKSSPSNHIIRKSKLSAKAKPPQKAKRSHWRSANAQFVGGNNFLLHPAVVL